MPSHHLPIIVNETLLFYSFGQFLTEVSVLEVELKLEVPVVFGVNLYEVFVSYAIVIIVLV